MKRLDAKDVKILALLEKNCRRPHSAIAREVGLSKQLTAYRINAMVQTGVIDRFITIINHHRLGYVNYTSLLKFQYLTEELEEQIIQDIVGMPETGWVVSTVGQWDLVLSVLVRDPKAYAQWLDRLFEQHHEHIQTHDFYVVTEPIPNTTHNSGAQPSSSYRFGSDWHNATLKSVDISILQGLVRDPRISLVELSQGAGSRPETVRARLEYLRKEHVLLGSSIKVNPQAMQREWYLIMISADYGRPEEKRLLIHRFLGHPQVSYVVESVGSCTLIVDMHVRDSSDLKKVLRTFTLEFGELIRACHPLLVHQEHKCFYLPENFT